MSPRHPRPSIGGRFVLGTLTTLALLAAPAHRAAAQRHLPEPWQRRSTPFVAVGGDAVFSSVRARATDPRIGDGYGFDVHGSVGVSALSLGGGYQRTEHDLTGTTQHATYSGFYVEPRVMLDLGAGNFMPYIAGRVGRTSVSEPPSLTGNTAVTHGTTYGAGGGLQVWLARSVALDLGALWSRIDYSQHRLSASDILRNGEDGVLLKAGLRLTP